MQVDPPMPGDVLVGDGGTDVGPEDVDDGLEYACLHVDLLTGEYVAVPGRESPSDDFEPVMDFSRSDAGFLVYSFFPWTIEWVEPEDAPGYVEAGDELSVSAFRTGARLDVDFVIRSRGVSVTRVEVVELGE